MPPSRLFDRSTGTNLYHPPSPLIDESAPPINLFIFRITFFLDFFIPLGNFTKTSNILKLVTYAFGVHSQQFLHPHDRLLELYIFMQFISDLVFLSFGY